MRLGSALLALVLGLSLTGCGLVSLRDLDGILDGTDDVERTEPSFGPDLRAATPLPIPGTTPVRERLFGWPVGDEGVVLSIGIHAGYDTETLSVDSQGWVVRVSDTSVTTTVDDYVTWRLTRAGLKRLLRAVERTGVRAAAPGDLGDGAVSPYSRTVHYGFGDDTGVSVSIRPEEAGISARERLWRLANRIASPRWHRGHIAVAPRPWTPPALGILAGPPNRTERSPLPPDAPFRPWPLDRSIRELSHGLRPNAYDEPRRALCLRGAAAAKVFALFTGENIAYLRVDDGERWELNVTVHTGTPPLYGSSPCSAAPPTPVEVPPLPAPTAPPDR